MGYGNNLGMKNNLPKFRMRKFGGLSPPPEGYVASDEKNMNGWIVAALVG